MENQAFNFTPDITNRNSALISDGVSQQTNMNSFVQSYLLDDLNAATTSQASLPDYRPSSSAIGHDEVLAGQWDIHQSNLDLSGWISSENGSGFSAVQSYGGSSKFSNELALTLATSQP